MWPEQNRSQFMLSQTSSLCFAVAGLAAVAAAFGAIVNLFLSGWMAVTGMLALALFYAALGILNLSCPVDESTVEGNDFDDLAFDADAKLPSMINNPTVDDAASPPRKPRRQLARQR